MASLASLELVAHASRALERADTAEHSLCVWINRLSHRQFWRQFFTVISRLGDGVFWYALMLLWPLVAGARGRALSLRMAVVGVAGLLIYKWLKRHLVRERPYITRHGVVAGTAPLDRYSFPSGHTLHAVSFTCLISQTLPATQWWCVPFAGLVAASRVVLGLHYPSDVLAGAAIGVALASSCLTWWPI